ncbi:MAG TPA: HD domain-containing protein [Candidatus Staskawiczbacteria bacterium]|nr:HD domain-containing protein [Candidatus Staskawiczbacteria bacterium]
MANDIKKIIEKSLNPKLIEDAFEFAKKAYKNKTRISGENYIDHAVRVAKTLSDMGVDDTTIAFGLLHDAVDDLPESAQKSALQEIKKNFGTEIADLIKKISGLWVVRYSLKTGGTDKFLLSKNKTENLRKMFLAIAADPRVILVELISRLDGLNFLYVFSDDQKKIYAFETLQVFAPVASRLGLSEIRRKLEDISFAYLFPEKYKWLRDSIKEEHEEREKYLKNFIPKLKKIFKKERVEFFQINYRTKSYWSTYKKLLNKDMDLQKIHDLLALRIIVKDIPTCYKALGVIHKHFKPLTEEINDYIAKPKTNGYRSLHTTIFSDQNKITELQIRTDEMHQVAEHGICAHWAYKENVDLAKRGREFEWVKNINFFENQIFTLTPKGDVIILKKESCPIDFAYSIHSEIGDHIESAKINGKIAAISEPLKNGDIVEIIINKKKKPSQDWLRFVKTSMAQSHIKKAVQKEGSFKIPIVSFVKEKIIEIAKTAKQKQIQKQQIKREGPRQIYLAGEKGMLVTYAKCCKPEAGDKVQAYLTKYRAAVLHKTSCKNFQELAKKFPEKVIDAEWK